MQVKPIPTYKLEKPMRGEVLSQPGRFGPLAADHPGVGMTCHICEAPMLVGDKPALTEIAPADDEEAEKAASGRAHNVECAIVHERCVFPTEGEDG